MSNFLAQLILATDVAVFALLTQDVKYLSPLRIANLIKPANKRKYDKIGGKKVTVK